ncbi:hypothetical protein GCM10027160_02820 [Streptomyces calidiresistens]
MGPGADAVDVRTTGPEVPARGVDRGAPGVDAGVVAVAAELGVGVGGPCGAEGHLDAVISGAPRIGVPPGPLVPSLNASFTASRERIRPRWWPVTRVMWRVVPDRSEEPSAPRSGTRVGDRSAGGLGIPFHPVRDGDAVEPTVEDAGAPPR